MACFQSHDMLLCAVGVGACAVINPEVHFAARRRLFDAVLDIPRLTMQPYVLELGSRHVGMLPPESMFLISAFLDWYLISSG